MPSPKFNATFRSEEYRCKSAQTGSGLGFERYLQHGLDAIPGDLYADAQEDECDHAQDAMSSLRRNKCRDDPARSLAEVDTYP